MDGKKARENARKLALLNKLSANSKATDKDVMEISRKINKGIAKWHDEQWKKRKAQKKH